MASAEDFARIFADLVNQTPLFDAMYQRRKTLTIADLDMTKTPAMCSSIRDLVYDESTRRPMFADADDLRSQVIAAIQKAKKPWRRWWKRKNDDHIERCFSIDDLYDFVVVIREYEDHSVIEYYPEHLGNNSMNNQASMLVVGATPFVVSST